MPDNVRVGLIGNGFLIKPPGQAVEQNHAVIGDVCLSGGHVLGLSWGGILAKWLPFLTQERISSRHEFDELLAQCIVWLAAAKAFFRRAFASRGRLPHKITLDGYQASHRAAREVLAQHRGGARTEIRSSKYLNNLIEQDHRPIKLRLGPMLGLKRFRNAAITIAGVELMHRIRKGQFKLGTLRIKEGRAPEIWNAVLAA